MAKETRFQGWWAASALRWRSAMTQRYVAARTICRYFLFFIAISGRRTRLSPKRDRICSHWKLLLLLLAKIVLCLILRLNFDLAVPSTKQVRIRSRRLYLVNLKVWWWDLGFTGDIEVILRRATSHRWRCMVARLLYWWTWMSQRRVSITSEIRIIRFRLVI